MNNPTPEKPGKTALEKHFGPVEEITAYKRPHYAFTILYKDEVIAALNRHLGDVSFAINGSRSSVYPSPKVDGLVISVKVAESPEALAILTNLGLDDQLAARLQDAKTPVIMPELPAIAEVALPDQNEVISSLEKATDVKWVVRSLGLKHSCYSTEGTLASPYDAGGKLMGLLRRQSMGFIVSTDNKLNILLEISPIAITDCCEIVKQEP